MVAALATVPEAGRVNAIAAISLPVTASLNNYCLMIKVFINVLLVLVHTIKSVSTSSILSAIQQIKTLVSSVFILAFIIILKRIQEAAQQAAERANALESDFGHLSFHGSLAHSIENIVQLSDRKFEILSRDLINRRYFTGAATLQLYVVRLELAHGVTLLIPIDASLTQVSGIWHQYRGLVKFHMLEINLNFRVLINSTTAYQLKLPSHWPIHNAFHVSLLKAYKGDPPQEPILDDPPEFEGPEEILQPEHIIRHEDKVLRNGKDSEENEMGYYRIGTYLRLRPSSRPAPALHADADTSTVRVDLKHADGGPPRSHDDQMVFHFDSVIQSTSQEATFSECARDTVEDVLCGFNGTILAYGQSGSGKTFTMSGDPKNPLHRGIIPRAIQRIFADKFARPESETSIHVSYLEVYNEVIYDLLTDKKEPLRIVSMMEENGQIEMKGLRQFFCETEEEALKHFSHGERRRCIGTNTLHKFSNRSHCMFTIYVERHSKGREHPERSAAKLNLVDLAGCERFKCIDAARQSEKEVLNINKSLTFLEQAVSELRKGQGHVSFRQSRLTMLLRDALGGNSKTVLIVCVLQEDEFLDETISTLRFAQRVKDLKTSAVLNKVVDSVQAERQLYERKIAELKRELAFYDALNGRNGISRDDLT
ncbi:hypothetical protein L7F22_005236 [Adiantum nelumboides]|nr:hypothetical protein [Adiantum nelumboides]